MLWEVEVSPDVFRMQIEHQKENCCVKVSNARRRGIRN